MDDLLTIILLIAILFLISTGIAFWSFKWYEFAIFIVVLSPLISAFFVPDVTVTLGDQNPTIGSYIRISMLLLMGCVGIIKYIKLKTLNQYKLPVHFILLGVFLLFSLMSTSYSINQKVTFIRSITFFAFFFFLLGMDSWITDRYQLNNILNVIFWAFIICLIINLVAYPIFPEKVWYFRAENRFKGLWSHPNEMGSFCMLSYPIMIWKYTNCDSPKKWLIVLCIIAMIFLHLLTGSRTSLIASITGICFWLFVLKHRGKLILFIGITSILLILLLFVGPSNLTRDVPESTTTLTGRTEIWRAAAVFFAERPILGYGYEVSGKIFDDPRFYDEKYKLWSGSSSVSLHSGYLSVGIGVGIFGLFLFYFPLLLPFWRSKNIEDLEYKALLLTILLMCLLTNITESYISGPSNIGSLILWIAWVMAGKVSFLHSIKTSEAI